MSGMQSGRELQSGSPDTHQLGLPVADCSSVRVAKEVRLVDAEPPGAALVYIGNTVEARVYYLDEVASGILRRCRDDQPTPSHVLTCTDRDKSILEALLATGILVDPDNRPVSGTPVSGSHVQLVTDDAPRVIVGEVEFGVNDGFGYDV